MNAEKVLELYDEARANIAEEPALRVERGERTIRLAGLWDCVIHSVTDWAWQPEA